MTGRRQGLERARFVARVNRFTVETVRANGAVVRAYLPNTARLTDLLNPGARLVLLPHDEAHRKTNWTVTRVWDGTWVALEAARAAELVAAHLEAGRPLPGWPRPVDIRREVAVSGHRFDLALDLPDGATAIVEVKSLSRAHGHTAPLSGTPSSRGVRHLDALTARARAGAPAGVVFVVQRGDVGSLDLSAPADAGWVDAVRRARLGGVAVMAYACDVSPRRVRLRRPLPVVDADSLGPVIRVLTEDDRDAALDVINAAAGWYADILPREEIPDPEMTPEQWSEESRRMTWYGAFDEDRLVGVVGLEYVADAALLRHWYVAPSHQRRGIGSRLREHLERQVVGVKRIIAGTYATNHKARGALERAGWQPSLDPQSVLRTYYDIPDDRRATSVTYERPVGRRSG